MKSRKNYNNACICEEKFDHDEKLCIHNNYYHDIFKSFILFNLFKSSYYYFRTKSMSRGIFGKDWNVFGV